VSQSFGYIPKGGIAGSYGRSMFSFLSSLQIFFQNGCTSLHSHQQCKRVPFSLHPRQHLLVVVLLMAILTGEVDNLLISHLLCGEGKYLAQKSVTLIYPNLCIFCLPETGSPYVAHSGLKLSILLPPECPTFFLTLKKV
jgi:hypothetical protein